MKTVERLKLILGFVFVIPMITWGQSMDAVNRSTLSSEAKDSKHSFSWSSSLLGLNRNNSSEQRKLVDARFKIKGHSELNSDLSLQVQASLRMQSGTTQTLNSSDASGNRIVLHHAALQYYPVPSFVASVGALSMDATHSSLAIDSMPFPAARVATQYYFSPRSYLGLFAETAVPTSASLSTNTQEFEETPSLVTFGIQQKSIWGQSSQWSFRLGNSIWDKLPASVAATSSAYGNSVDMTSENLGRFKYAFNVLDLNVQLNTQLTSSLLSEIQLQGLYNSSAPASLNTAYMASGSLTLQAGRHDYTAGALAFHIEKDATVAYYGPTAFFNTNRNGYGLELGIHFLKDNFKINSRYTEAEVIFESPTQSREKSVLVMLETSYADF